MLRVVVQAGELRLAGDKMLGRMGRQDQGDGVDLVLPHLRNQRPPLLLHLREEQSPGNKRRTTDVAPA